MKLNGVYLVRDWTDCDHDSSGCPRGETNTVVHGSEVVRVIADARRFERKITVVELGDCLLDWS